MKDLIMRFVIGMLAIVNTGEAVAIQPIEVAQTIPFEALSYCDQLDAIVRANKSVFEFVISSGRYNDYAWAVRSDCVWHQEQIGVANSVLYPQPIIAPSTVANSAQQECDPSYPSLCLASPPPNLNCEDIGTRNFQVVGSDPHGFDRDRDGIGCEE